MDPLPLAEKESVHNLVRQDRKSTYLSSSENSKHRKIQDDKTDFQTLSKVRNFVSKYYKDCDTNIGL